MKPYRFLSYLLLSTFFLFSACQDLDTVNPNDPDRDAVLSNGSDLMVVLKGGYVNWWRGVHDDHPAVGLSVAADAYTMSWANFGAQRLGQEPRTVYNNRPSEESDYKQVVEDAWFGCLSAVSTANDILLALDKGVTIDNGGPQDQAVEAAAHFLRGVSWGYLGLIFDQALLVDENTDLEGAIPFTPYGEMIAPAVAELEKALSIAEAIGPDFIHDYFNGLTLDDDQFIRLSHAYAARFLAQWPRTPEENETVNWQAVLDHAGQGLNYDFAPIADGNFWQSYHNYVFAETGEGPFWARVDQRLVAALDPSQPARYPEVSKGEAPLANPMATSADARLASDFIFVAANNFPVDRGEYFYSHYKHNRNVTDPGFAGNGVTDGPMPAFLAADNDLLRAEALFRLGSNSEAVAVINAGTRVTRGQLPLLNSTTPAAKIAEAIIYERAIELLSTAPMSLWLDRRRWAPRVAYTELDALGGLQTGTPAQLPVPADELSIQSLPAYNFGGALDPEGIEAVY